MDEQTQQTLLQRILELQQENIILRRDGGQSSKPLTREPLMPPSNPEFPFQKTVTDFFDLRVKNFLLYADRYTGWVEVTLMSSGNAKAT